MDDLKTRLRTLVDFLRGAGPLEGRWFGEDHQPAFWWRKHCGDINLAVARIAVLEAEVARITAEREALGKACREWSETSQSNYQRAKRAEQLLSDIGETVPARDAAQVPEVKALIEALKETASILQACLKMGKIRNGDSYRIGGVYLQAVGDALDSADTALRKIKASQ